ncbi:MAG TPA: hypothetical protein EYN75_00070, partial [Candidatus Nitrosopelagicus sp.]|nr:hypothetical protein [Candidatus Nitrosopelagicus sp.]
ALTVVLLTLTAMVFPALFSSYFGLYTENLEPFELGHQSIFLITSNVIIFGLGILYYKKKIPSTLNNAIEKVRTFELSKRVTLVSLFVIIGVYVGFSIPELFIDESTQWGDYEVLEEALGLWPFGESDNIFVQEQNDRYVRMFLLDVSYDLFQNIKLLPFIATILVVVFTYLIAAQFCQKRFAGIISVIVLLQSHIFLKFDTIAVYENLIRKKWFLSPVFYILAFFTKAYVAPYFLMTLFTAYRSEISSGRKIAILISYVVIVGLAIALIFLGETVYPDVIEINYNKFILGFQGIASQLRFDFFFIMTILPVTVGLLLLSKNKLKESDSILILIFGTIIVSPVLVMFTLHYDIHAYRFIPLLVFFSMGVGMFFSKKSVKLS